MKPSHDIQTKRELQEFQRRSAIQLRKNGVKPEIIAKSFGVTTQTGYNWTSKAKRLGEDALKATKGTGAPPQFPEKHFQELADAIRDRGRPWLAPADEGHAGVFPGRRRHPQYPR